MNEPSIKKNFTFSTIYHVLTLIIPFITAPYISRVLGADGVGVYSYTNSIQMYFSMFASLGTISYGSREIARCRNDTDKRSQLFWEIEILTVLTTLVCLAAWGIFVFFSGNYQLYYSILTFSLLAIMFDISWFFIGIEQFKYTVTQNGIFKIIGVFFLFLFVKKQTDLYLFVLIMSLTTLLSNISMWIYLPKFVNRVSVKTIKLEKHFKETLVYFIPTIATSIYTVLDKTLIGLITKEEVQNGYYEQATKIINMAKILTFGSLNSVLGSRLSFLFAERKYEEIKERISFSMEYILFMGIGICFGILSVSDTFVPMFFGEGYEPVIELLYLMSPLVVIIGVSNCLGAQYYNPAGLRAQSAKYIIIGSVINLIMNLLLIPKFNCKGAVLASVVAECTISILYLNNDNGYYTWTALFIACWKKIVAGIIMLVILRLVDFANMPDLISNIFCILLGALIYIFLLLFMKDTVAMSLRNRIIKSEEE